MNLYPTLYYQYALPGDIEAVYMRFHDYGSAKEAYRRIRDILRQKDLPHVVRNAGPEWVSGEYQFDLIFDRGITRPEVAEALEKPPYSNRGVTKNKKETKGI